MSFRFEQRRGLILVRATLEGVTGKAVVRLALDTGATTTLIRQGLLQSIGCDVWASTDRVEMTTGSGQAFVPRVTLKSIRALGQRRPNLTVIAHDLSSSARLDGLLGLDFLRRRALSIDFRGGRIKLS